MAVDIHQPRRDVELGDVHRLDCRSSGNNVREDDDRRAGGKVGDILASKSGCLNKFDFGLWTPAHLNFVVQRFFGSRTHLNPFVSALLDRRKKGICIRPFFKWLSTIPIPRAECDVSFFAQANQYDAHIRRLKVKFKSQIQLNIESL